MGRKFTAINLSLGDFIYPYFLRTGVNKREEIEAFPGVYRFSLDWLLKDIEEILSLGIDKVLLFGIPQEKDAWGLQTYSKNNIVAQAVKKIKNEFPGLTVMTDVCLCAYTSHGHCGILKSENQPFINNTETIKILTKIALAHAEAGADYVAPSAIAKGQVSAIRKELDQNAFKKTKIMGYSAKFASNFYGPFRNACNSAPQFGDRRTYQLDYADTGAALEEIRADIKEGADIVMVKPALSYLDIIREAALEFDFPLAAYNTSAEYALVKFGAEKGLWEEKKIAREILTSIKRAGADLIISYHTKEVAQWLREN